MTTDAEKLLSNAIRLRDSGRSDIDSWAHAVEYVRLGLAAAKEEGAREAWAEAAKLAGEFRTTFNAWEEGTYTVGCRSLADEFKCRAEGPS